MDSKSFKFQFTQSKPFEDLSLTFFLMDINFQEWIDQNFPTKDRLQMMIVKAENILTPESLQKMFRLHQAVQNISVEDKTFKNICKK